jgi:hypothetical protein
VSATETRTVIRPAVPEDASRLLELFGELADYEKIRDQLVASEEQIRESLFGEHPAAAALIAERDGESVGYAVCG